MKNIYKEFNNIEVDIDEINSINVELDDITKARIKNNLKSSIKDKKPKHILRNTIIASAALILFFSVFFRGSIITFADNIPVLNSLFSGFINGSKTNVENYTKVIGSVKEDKGYKVKLEEVVMDNFNFMFVYTLTTPEKIDTLVETSKGFFPHSDLKIITLNGKEIQGGGGGTHEKIDDYTVRIYESSNIFGFEDGKDFDIGIDIKKIGDVEGNWKFDFNMSKEKILGSTKTFSPKNKIKEKKGFINKATITFDSISFSPIATTIVLKSRNEFQNDTMSFSDENGKTMKITDVNFMHYVKEKRSYITIYKFDPRDKIPDKIYVSYTNPYSKKGSKTELILK